MAKAARVLAALKRDGWTETRRSGSHRVLVKGDQTGRVVGPDRPQVDRCSYFGRHIRCQLDRISVAGHSRHLAIW